MIQRLILLFLLFGFWIADASEHPILYMISPPRSISTAFMRMMHARGDFEIFHEPSHFPFSLVRYPEFAQNAYQGEAPSTFEEVREQILNAAQLRPVFVKEMGLSSEPFILSDDRFFRLPHVKVFFLVRNPHHSLLSFYKKAPQTIDFLFEVMAYDAVLRLLEKSIADGHCPPCILLAEDLLQDPEAELEKFCRQIGIPFIPGSSVWEPLDGSFDPIREWHEYKFPGMLDLFHSDAINSTGFGKPTAYWTDELGNPTFEEVEDKDDRKKIQEVHEQILPIYRRILSYKNLLNSD